jgi:hypothetical protein
MKTETENKQDEAPSASAVRDCPDSTGYIVRLETGVWLAPWDGDPGRTLVESSAKVFPDAALAYKALAAACRYRDFSHATLYKYNPEAHTHGLNT